VSGMKRESLFPDVVVVIWMTHRWCRWEGGRVGMMMTRKCL